MVELTNTTGLWALLALIPFIILYLRKPKPQDRTIPSLMFLIKNRQISKRFQFLQRFLINMLFFLQLLAFILLALAITEPFTILPYDQSLENTVLIIDASASMQADEGGSTRFEEAIKEAKSKLSGRNTIILAEHIPLLILEDENSETAIDILGTLEAKATTTNLGDAMLLSNDILGNRPGRIVVISDFNQVNAADLLVVKRTLSSEEVVVEFIDVSNNAENAGIINAEIRKNSIKVYVKNFNSVRKQVNLKLVKDGNTLAESGNFEILPESIEPFLFDDTPAGLSEIVLEPEDDLNVDNKVFVSAPLKKKVAVLLITNKHDSHLENALLASPDIGLNIVNPPVLTLNTRGERIEPYEHDVIIVHEVNNIGKRDGILPGTFPDISTFVKAGGSLITTSQSDLHEIAMADLAVINLAQPVNQPARACIDSVNEITKQFENEQCFATVGQYIDGTARQGTTVLANANSVPIMVFKEHFKGRIFYYGIIDEQSDFKTLPSYPIYWNALVNFMAQTENIKEFNVKTGSVATIAEQKIQTPSTSLTTSRVLFDEAGIYEIAQRNIAANLIDEKESSVVEESSLKTQGEGIDVLIEHSNQKEISLSVLILIVVFIALMLELFYIKRRGDI